ncbi:recG [Scenedesmus sp. PABB004]|nr:recG [Scenedesmus sp. PABB004]
MPPPPRATPPPRGALAARPGVTRPVMLAGLGGLCAGAQQHAQQRAPLGSRPVSPHARRPQRSTIRSVQSAVASAQQQQQQEQAQQQQTQQQTLQQRQQELLHPLQVSTLLSKGAGAQGDLQAAASAATPLPGRGGDAAAAASAARHSSSAAAPPRPVRPRPRSGPPGRGGPPLVGGPRARPQPGASWRGGAAAHARAAGGTHMPHPLCQEHLETIATRGLAGLPGWRDWGDAALHEQWERAARLLPAAVDRLAAVSRSGPVRLVCFDLETCGTQPPQDVTELAACAGDAATPPFSRMVRPLSAIDAEASRVTGIHWDMVSGAAPLPAVLLEWVQWLTALCEAAPDGTARLVLAGHNIRRFDLNVLRPWAAALRLRGLQELLGPKGAHPDAAGAWPTLDTLRLAQPLQDGAGWPNAKLQTLRAAFGIPENNAHRALDDVRVNLEVFGRLAQMSLQDGLQDGAGGGHASAAGMDAHELAHALLERGEAELARVAGQRRELAPRQQQAQQQQQQARQQQRQQRQQQQQQEQQQQQQEQQPQQRQPQQRQQQAPPGSAPGPGSGGGRSAESAAAPALAPALAPGEPDPLLLPVDAAAVEAGVSVALGSLSERDLRFDSAELAAAWAPLSAAVDECKAFSPTQRDKLRSAGLTNVLKVLMCAPRIAVHADRISVGAAAGDDAAAAPPSAAGGAAPGGAASSSDESEEDDGEQTQLVELTAKCVGAIAPRPWPGKPAAVWTAIFEVPADPPEAGPVLLRASRWEFSFNAQAALSACRKAHAAAVAARAAGTPVIVSGRVRPLASPFSYGERLCTWETVGTPALEFAADGGASDGDDEAAAGPPDSSVAAGAGGDGARLAAVYKGVKELKPEDWRTRGRQKGVADKALDMVAARDAAELLPAGMRASYRLPGLAEALADLHRPRSLEAHAAARRRLAFQELVLVQMAQLLERYWLQRGVSLLGGGAPSSAASTASASGASSDDEAAATPAPAPAKRAGRPAKVEAGGGRALQGAAGAAAVAQAPPQAPAPAPGGAPAHAVTDRTLVEAARRVLPFSLTADQESALGEVLADMAGPAAMLRLLQGDVGCGKTAVAALACLAAAGSGFQALLLAPTELLASQHAATLAGIAERLPLSLRPRVGLLTSSGRAKEREEVKRRVAEGQLDVLVSTQAALWVRRWRKLALVVVDEQHKFGVKQRERLLQELPAPPHLLLMTATPIPRTLALVHYGGLQLSTIAAMPPGRSPVATRVVVDSDAARREVCAAIHDELRAGGRAYVVCPLVNESERDALAGVRAAQEEHARLTAAGEFGGVAIGLLHGKMRGEEKAEVLRRFSSGEAPVLISSTVVEVGIDEPEASVMLVENAARFGLAQLHQLRGRVGRGARASRCYLFAPPDGEPGAAAAAARLRVLERSRSGLEIAEADLRMRGPGDVWGTKQSGKSSVFTSLTWQELQAAPALLEHARAAAAELLPRLGASPQLKAAMLAYGLLTLREEGGGGPPVALRDGVSGV